MHRIVARETLAPAIVRFWIEAPAVARKCQPGQFVIIRLHEDAERIPLTIAESDRDRGTIALIVQGVGKSTRELNSCDAGRIITDVAGPLGRPTHIRQGGRVCCVGGGIGAAVVLPIARALGQAGTHVTVILGARTSDLIILERELAAVSARTITTTDDGSRGRQGLVTDALREVMAESPPFDEVIAVGPLPMMRAVCETTRPAEIRTTVSLNPVMVDGTGMCGGCRVTVSGRQKFVCVDGPEFDGHLVDFDELIARLAAYREDEAAALARYEAACSSVPQGSR